MFLKYFPGIDDGDEAIDSYVREEDEVDERIEYRELDMDRLALEASEIDSTGITVANVDRLKHNEVTNNEDSSGIYKIHALIQCEILIISDTDIVCFFNSYFR